jgi:hypothetical protein
MSKCLHYLKRCAGWVLILGVLALSGCSVLNQPEDSPRPWDSPNSGAASPDWITRGNGSF